MIAFSFRVPPAMKRGRGPVLVVLVIERENLDRMKEGDPFDLQFQAYRGHWDIDVPLRDVDLIIAYEETLNTVMAFHQKGDIAGLMKFLERGRRHQHGDAIAPAPLRKV